MAKRTKKQKMELITAVILIMVAFALGYFAKQGIIAAQRILGG